MEQRPRPAGVKHGARCFKYVPVRCAVKRYCFRPCILKLGVFVAQRTGRMLMKGTFSELSFMMSLFTINFCVRHFAVCLIAL